MAIIVALLLTAGLIFGVESWIYSGEYASGDVDDFKVLSNDSASNVTHKIYRLQNANECQHDIYLMGGSTMFFR